MLNLRHKLYWLALAVSLIVIPVLLTGRGKHGSKSGSTAGHGGGAASGASMSEIAVVSTALEEAWCMSASAPSSLWWRVRIPAIFAVHDPDKALRLASLPGGSAPDDVTAEVIDRLARFNPEKAVKWGVPRLDQMKNPRLKLRSAVIIGLAACDIDRKVAGELYQRAKSSPGTGGKTCQLNYEALDAVIDYTYLAALAAKLKSGDERIWLEKIQAAVKRDSKLVKSLPYWVSGLAKGSPELAHKWISTMSGIDKLTALTYSTAEVSLYDGEAAKRWLPDIELAKGNELRSMAYGQAAMYVIVATGRSKPNEALAIARSVKDSRFRTLCLGLAAKFQNKEIALRALREALDATTVNDYYIGSDMAWIASMAYERDQSVGIEMFTATRKWLSANKEEGARDNLTVRVVKLIKRTPRTISHKRSCDTADFAMYYAAVDPVQSRKMLESEFKRHKASPTKEGNYALANIAVAMAAIDVKRAIEMAKQIPAKDPTDRCFALIKIGRYALASKAERARMNYLHWTRSEAWVYGGPDMW